MEAVVLLADVKGSRRMDERDAWADRLRDTLGALNRTYSRSLEGRFEVQKGVDEFGAVLRVGAPVGNVLVRLWCDLHPIPVRISLVKGELDVAPSPQTPRRRLPSVTRFDGPAFHAAADGLARVEKEGGYLALRLNQSHLDEMLAHYANLAYLHLLRATPRQKELLLAYEEMGSQVKVAQTHGISQPAVSEALAATHARTLLPALALLRSMLNAPEDGATHAAVQ